MDKYIDNSRMNIYNNDYEMGFIKKIISKIAHTCLDLNKNQQLLRARGKGFTDLRVRENFATISETGFKCKGVSVYEKVKECAKTDE